MLGQSAITFVTSFAHSVSVCTAQPSPRNGNPEDASESAGAWAKLKGCASRMPSSEGYHDSEGFSVLESESSLDETCRKY
ncbi:hypothetical protein C8R44DRAFT_766173 [Mycena epipterygia]|nr:hypothetical protein C8R44DRAFT_766173 [Mycena epipterygia]